MESFSTCTVVRYWSKVLLSIILILLNDLGVKVMEFEDSDFFDKMFWLNL